MKDADTLVRIWDESEREIRFRIANTNVLALNAVRVCKVADECDAEWMRDALYKGFYDRFVDMFGGIQCAATIVPFVLEDMWMEGRD